MTRYIFVTGGVVSSLGKVIASASLAAILEARGLKVTMLKLDPYINVDPGTMSPFQHGEVFVTHDGADLREFDPRAWRARTGLVLQEDYLFAGTVRENLVMGRERVTEASLARAIEMSSCGRVIDQIDGRSVVLYLDPTTFTPAAVFADTTSAAVDGPEIHLDGVLYDATGTRFNELPIKPGVVTKAILAKD